MKFKTLSSIVNYLKKEYDSEVIELQDGENNIVELIPCINDIAKENIDLINITSKEYKVLTNELYGEYSYCSDIEEVKANLLIDFIDEKITLNRFKTITQYKKYRLENC